MNPCIGRLIKPFGGEGANRGLATAKEQDALLFEVMRPVIKTAQAKLDRSGIPCAKVGQLIDGLSSDFTR